MKFQSLIAVSVLSCLVGLASAQKPADATASTFDALRKLHAEYAKSRDDMKPLTEQMQKEPKTSETRKDLAAKLNGMRIDLMKQQKEFLTAFEASDWAKLDPKADSELLKDGLPVVARGEDPAKAVAAGKLFLANFGDDRMADMIRSNSLPMAMLAAGSPGDAIETLGQAVEKAEGPAKARALITLGDVLAASGDAGNAAKKYAEAAGLADDRTKSYVTLRQDLIGKPAPDIDSKTWIGGEPKTLSSMKGKVVLVDFWATWCPPCRAVMPGISEMYTKHHAEGLEVIGVTRFYARGSMPANKSEMAAGGKQVTGMTPETFPAHVEQFRKNTEIAYPFVIGEESNFKDYKVSGIPTLAVVGRDGNIALITVGSGSEGLLNFAVKNLLANGKK